MESGTHYYQSKTIGHCEIDWRYLETWLSVEDRLGGDLVPRMEKDDYEAFRREFPDVKDYLDFYAWSHPAHVVLAMERERFVRTRKRRIGLHGSFGMVLDKNSFLEKFT